jgi:hypothetical protein
MRRAGARIATSFLLASLFARSARAEETLGDPFATKPAFALVGTSFVGDGVRFNNPYRLSTVLGSTAESLSRTAAYTELGVAILFGPPDGVRHGLALRWSIAIEGISQSALAPSYEIWKRWRRFAAYGRLGPSIVLSPDETWGGEASCGGVWLVRAGIGVGAEVVGDLFFGAGTRDVATATYPILSAQLGVTIDLEVLP